MRWVVTTGSVVLSWLLAVPATLPAQNPASEELQKIHVLMVFDTRANDLARSLRIDEWRMRRFWQETVPASRQELTVLTGKDVTRANILDHYRDLKIGPNDGVVFYYAGHAATDRKTGKHYFALAGDRHLFREELVKQMEAVNAGLTLLLTDCCSTPREIAGGRNSIDQTNAYKVKKVTAATEIHPTVRHLLFQSRGLVDVTAATNNASWSDLTHGGLFTRSLCRMLEFKVKELDVNGDQTLTWKEFFPQMQKETQSLYGAWRLEMIARGETGLAEKAQQPHAFQLGETRTASARRQALIGIQNTTDRTIRYRCLWTNKQKWDEVQLRPGQKGLHMAPLDDESDLPRLTVTFANGKSRVLEAVAWKGEGKPSFTDAKPYKIGVGHE